MRWSSQHRRVGAALALTAAALTLLIWAASADFPRASVELPGADIAEESPEPDEDDAASVPPSQEEGLSLHPDAEPGELSPWIWITLQAAGLIALLVVVGLMVLLLRRMVRWWAGRRADRSRPEALDEVLEAAAEATGLQARRRAAQRIPRDAVVACWAAVEDAAEHAGLRRTGAETSEEFTVRVLDRWEVDEQVITDLAELYRTARFSRADLTDADRRRAVAALAEVNAAIETAIEARRAERDRHVPPARSPEEVP